MGLLARAIVRPEKVKRSAGEANWERAGAVFGTSAGRGVPDGEYQVRRNDRIFDIILLKEYLFSK
ncbi:MAG: hypothetical protein J0J14_04635 [Hyphomicrobium sp.]|nr:hypothetical protein [Hyphomicrobium sp.]